MPCAEASDAHNSSVWEREDSDVKLRSREQPLAARLRAIASPIPEVVVSDVLIANGGEEDRTPRSTSNNAKFAFQNASHVETGDILRYR